MQNNNTRTTTNETTTLKEIRDEKAAKQLEEGKSVQLFNRVVT